MFNFTATVTRATGATFTVAGERAYTREEARQAAQAAVSTAVDFDAMEVSIKLTPVE